MPRIFQVNQEHTKNLSRTPLVDTHSEDAVWQGVQQIGKGIQGIGGSMEGIGNMLHDHQESAQLAEEAAERIKFESDFNNFVTENPTDIEGQIAERERMFEQYNSARSERAKFMSRQTQDKVANDDKVWSAQIMARSDGMILKARIRDNNAKLMDSADLFLRQGMYDEFKKTFDQVNMDPVSKGLELRRRISEGLYYDGMNELMDLKTTDEVKDFLQNVSEMDAMKDKDGHLVLDDAGEPVMKYVNMEYDQGGLGIGGRQRLINNAKVKLRAIWVDQTKNAERALKDIESGEMDTVTLDAMYERGELDDKAHEILTQETKAQSTYAVTMDTDAQGNETVSAQVRDLISVGTWEFIRSFGRKEDPYTEEWNLAIALIAETKDFPIGARRELFGELLTAKSESLEDWEEERSEFSVTDRDISKHELSVRKDFNEYLRKRMFEWEPRTWGSVYRTGHDTLKKLFDDNPEITSKEAWQVLLQETIVPGYLEDLNE